jgi:acetyltransferase-like isoleucine patch superfamily enzyme
MSAPAPAADPGSDGWSRRLRGLLGIRGIDRLGRGTVLSGKPHIANDGRIEFGEDCRIASHPVQSHFVAMPGATIAVGDRVVISYGAAISALRGIVIGDDTEIGPFCVILDNDFHRVGDRESTGLVAPVQIGHGVKIGARVTMLRGTRIGDGARVLSGSTISGAVAGGAVVAGVPARAVGSDHVKHDPAVAAVVMRILGLGRIPAPSERLSQVPGWNPGKAVRLLLTLEETFGITLDANLIGADMAFAALFKLVSRERAARD